MALRKALKMTTINEYAKRNIPLFTEQLARLVRIPSISQDVTHAAACHAGFGKEPLYVGSGGSIGAIPPLQLLFPQAPVVMIAQSLLSDGYHAPNERFEFAQAEAGMRTMAGYLGNLGRRS